MRVVARLDDGVPAHAHERPFTCKRRVESGECRGLERGELRQVPLDVGPIRRELGMPTIFGTELTLLDKRGLFKPERETLTQVATGQVPDAREAVAQRDRLETERVTRMGS